MDHQSGFGEPFAESTEGTLTVEEIQCRLRKVPLRNQIIGTSQDRKVVYSVPDTLTLPAGTWGFRKDAKMIKAFLDVPVDATLEESRAAVCLPVRIEIFDLKGEKHVFTDSTVPGEIDRMHSVLKSMGARGHVKSRIHGLNLEKPREWRSDVRIVSLHEGLFQITPAEEVHLEASVLGIEGTEQALTAVFRLLFEDGAAPAEDVRVEVARSAVAGGVVA